MGLSVLVREGPGIMYILKLLLVMLKATVCAIWMPESSEYRGPPGAADEV
jgi:hypothetical protein